MPLILHTIVCSTRPGRVGLPVAQWFYEVARQHGGFDAKLVDLAAFNLPIYDEPKHPVLQQYEHEHTKRWSASVSAADAFVFVTPEYNYGPPPSLLNALNYVYKEWNYKPAAFVSYGGVSGGLRAVQIEKHTLSPDFPVRPDGAVYQWRKVPPSELSVELVADERLGWATDRAEAS